MDGDETGRRSFTPALLVISLVYIDSFNHSLFIFPCLSFLVYLSINSSHKIFLDEQTLL